MFTPPGRESWPVTLQTLHTLRDNFYKAKQLGIQPTLQWDHSNSAKDRICTIEDLEIEGDKLYAIFEPDLDEDLKRLDGPCREFSVQLHEPFRDGLGNTYDAFITHVGVVNLPVVPGQEPVTRLSLISGEQPMKTKVRNMATGEGEGDGGDNTMISVKDVVAMLREAGKAVPDEVKTADELKLAWKVLNPSAAPEEKPSEEAPSIEEVPVVQASLIRENAALKAKIASFEALQESTYRAEVEQLVVQGSLLATDRENLIAFGKNNSWNLSTLDPFKRLKAGSAVKTTSKVRQLSLGGQTPEETAEQRKERARAAFK